VKRAQSLIEACLTASCEHTRPALTDLVDVLLPLLASPVGAQLVADTFVKLRLAAFGYAHQYLG
jgi:hypothetical protein